MAIVERGETPMHLFCEGELLEGQRDLSECCSQSERNGFELLQMTKYVGEGERNGVGNLVFPDGSISECETYNHHQVQAE